MYRIACLIIFISTNLFAETCVETLFYTNSYKGIVPTSTYYQDSSYQYSDVLYDDIKIKYNWDGQLISSIVVNGDTIYRLYNNDNEIIGKGNEIAINKSISNDTAIYLITSYEDGIFDGNYIIERHWNNGIRRQYISIDQDALASRPEEFILSNDSLIEYEIVENHKYVMSYVYVNNEGKCQKYDILTQGTTKYEMNYYKSGFSITEIRNETPYPRTEYFKYFDANSSLRNGMHRRLSINPFNTKYNLKGQKLY